MSAYADEFLHALQTNNPHEPEFLQAVREVVASLDPVLDQHPEYRDAAVLERLAEPDRVIIFRVPWADDDDRIRVNRGYRVQFNSALGPYKGGMRFHPTVNLSVLKFLGYEQIFKNALTNQAIGGGKGGADFDPKGRSDAEVMRFCQSLITELAWHIGPDRDIPAGDIGVGAREIGYMFGMYKRLRNRWSGVFTGKALHSGGSLLRPEATGYGCVYFACEMLAAQNKSIEGKRCIVSGSGNVAQFAAEKLIQLGAKPVTLSDSGGSIHDPDGVDADKLEFVKDLKNNRRGRIFEYAEKYPSADYTEHGPDSDGNPVWRADADCAFPCATQNELTEPDARAMIDNSVALVSEGANMPCTHDAVELFNDNGVLYGPGKAANAGGVAVSALEMAQNSQRMRWSREDVDARLRDIMHRIHDDCAAAADTYGYAGNYAHGANIAAFTKVADAVLAQGLV